MWTYKQTGRVIESIDDVPDGAIGFIYLIECKNGKSYIGQKSLYTKRKKHFGKKKLAEVVDKRKKTYEYEVKESNWLSYTGSNKELNEAIESGLMISKKILKFCNTKKQISYYETKYLMVYGVIEPGEGDSFYNGNVLGKYYRKDLLDGQDSV